MRLLCPSHYITYIDVLRCACSGGHKRRQRPRRVEAVASARGGNTHERRQRQQRFKVSHLQRVGGKVQRLRCNGLLEEISNEN